MDLREIRAEATERHPWERARARFLFERLQEAGLTSRPVSLLDLGSGDGFFADHLSQRLPPGSRVVCCDSNYTDEQMRDLTHSWRNDRLSFAREPSGRFDVVLLLDVLEHVPEDVSFLRGIAERHLLTGGFSLISVPAWMAMFTRHDIGVAHYRRYRPRQLARVISSSGLQMRRCGGLFHCLLVARAIQKSGELVRGIRSVPAPESAPAQAASDVAQWCQGRVVTSLVDGVLLMDNTLSAAFARRGLQIPGLSIWALARQV